MLSNFSSLTVKEATDRVQGIEESTLPPAGERNFFPPVTSLPVVPQSRRALGQLQSWEGPRVSLSGNVKGFHFLFSGLNSRKFYLIKPRGQMYAGSWKPREKQWRRSRSSWDGGDYTEKRHKSTTCELPMGFLPHTDSVCVYFPTTAFQKVPENWKR